MLINDLSMENMYGYGVGGARYYLRTVNPWFSHSHNSALETIYMSGYLGLLGMSAAGICGLIACLAHWRYASARVLATAGIYVIAAGMMNPSWYDTSSLIVLSILCSCSWAVSRYQLQASKDFSQGVRGAYFGVPRFG
jgi:O-antigen ligase